FLFCLELSRSGRVAAIASCLYMGNPNYLYFSGEFSYESLALPLAVLLFLFIVRSASDVVGARPGFLVLGVLTLLSIVVTHHVTSYAVTIFLAVWVVLGLLLVRRRPLLQRGPIHFLLISLAADVAWFF